MTRRLRAGLLTLWIGSAVALADTPVALVLAEHFRMATVAPTLDVGRDLAAAEQVQETYLDLLQRERGSLVGYKAGLTSIAAQRRLGVDHPLMGMLLRDMLRPSPAQVSLHSGARLLVEADLLLRVASPTINTARDWGELLRSVDAIIPCVEVPDLLYAQDVNITAPLLQAANVGARWMILGEVILLRPGEDWYRRLAEFEVSLHGPQGELARGQGRALLGHPLAVVEWLRDAVQARGRHLDPGDLLSLGSLTPLRPAQAGNVRAVYTGLDPQGPVGVEVEFIDAVAASVR